MSRPWFLAVGVDYDGTLTEESRPAPEVLAALAETRAAGVRVVLVTGRILEDLRAILPEADRLFDAIVGENGGVLAMGGVDRPLVDPVDPRLASALARAGVPVHAGQVLLATDAVHDAAVLEHVGRLGLDCHLLHNRAALMVLPAQVSKGTGLVHALTALDLTAHDCVGIGDAENDHALLDACEVGVAVGNAIDALKQHADLILAEGDGLGVARFLESQVRGGDPVEPRRWQLDLGTFDDGTVARIPGSQVRVLVRGGSGSGKSFVAGLLAERALDLGYRVCAIDPEGDHSALSSRPGVVSIAGPLPPIEQVVALIERGRSSLVVDLSLEPWEIRERYARRLLEALVALKERRGVPHWIVVDEAHVPLSREHGDPTWLASLPPGLCLVTWRPEWLCDVAATGHDVVLEAVSPEAVDLYRPGQPPRRFRPGRRAVPHQRHAHKYVDGAAEHPFWFRTPGGRTGRLATNLREFDAELRLASDAVVLHHLRSHDFSRWVGDVFRDTSLAGSIRDIEDRVADPAAARLAVCSALERRYPAAGLTG